MAHGSLCYISQIDGHSKKFTKTDSDSLKLLDTLKKDYRDLLINDYACGHGAEIFVFDEGKLVFRYTFNNGDWRDRLSIFSRSK
jgi:hypothetical protein